MGKLKAYIQANNSSVSIDSIKNKNRLRFLALDSKPSGWNKERLQSMKAECREYFIDVKIKKHEPSFPDSKRNLFLSSKPEDEEQRNVIIDELLSILSKFAKPKQVRSKTSDDAKGAESENADTANPEQYNPFDPTIHGQDDEEESKAQRQIARNHDEQNDNEMTSVSTHPSMPSLMSDDESDEDMDDDEYDEDSDDSEDAVSETKGKENIVMDSSNEEEQKEAVKISKGSKKKESSKKKKKDDFGSSLPAGFLTKKNKKKKQPKVVKKKQEKKETKKEIVKKSENDDRIDQLKQMGHKEEVIKAVSATLDKN